MNLSKLIKENSNAINNTFGFVDLKRNKNRDVISSKYSKHEVATIAKYCEAVQKIMTGSGCNAFIYVAPKGFNDFIFHTFISKSIRQDELTKRIKEAGIKKSNSATKKKI